jgi:hypothetical protein
VKATENLESPTAANAFGGEHFRRRALLAASREMEAVSPEPPSYAPDMSKTAEDDQERDGDGED